MTRRGEAQAKTGRLLLYRNQPTFSAFCRIASAEYLASPTHADESQLLSGSVCSVLRMHLPCLTKELHIFRKGERSAKPRNEADCVCLLTWGSLYIRLGSRICELFNFSIFLLFTSLFFFPFYPSC